MSIKIRWHIEIELARKMIVDAKNSRAKIHMLISPKHLYKRSYIFSCFLAVICACKSLGANSSTPEEWAKYNSNVVSECLDYMSDRVLHPGAGPGMSNGTAIVTGYSRTDRKPVTYDCIKDIETGKLAVTLSSSTPTRGFTPQDTSSQNSTTHLENMPDRGGRSQPYTASVPAGTSNIRSEYNIVFHTIEEFDFPNSLNKALAKKTTIEAVELLIMFLTTIQSNSSAQALGITANNFAAMFTADPTAALSLVKDDILIGAGKSLITGLAAKFATNLIFDLGPLAVLPNEIRVPSEALFEATMLEGIGLVQSTAKGSPTALVGPVLNRILDIYEIYQATKALERTQQTGLLAVAIGTEMAADLIVINPSDHSRKIIGQWFTDTRRHLLDIVGSDDTPEVMEIVGLGYSALAALKVGNRREAIRNVVEMQQSGEQADGPLFLSAEGPIDLLLKISAGGDAPKQAATTMVSVTSLASLFENSLSEELISGKAGSWEANPNIRSFLEGILSNTAVTSAYGCEKAYGPLNEEMAEKLLVNTEISIRKSGNQFVQRKVGQSMINSQGELCWSTSTSCFKLHYCSSGEALFTTSRGKNYWTHITEVKPLKTTRDSRGASAIRPSGIVGRQLSSNDNVCKLAESWPVYNDAGQLDLPTTMSWSGNCSSGFADGEGSIVWYKSGKAVFDLHIGKQWDTELNQGEYSAIFDRSKFIFLLDHCRDAPTDSISRINFRPSRGINVYPVEKRPESYFANIELVLRIVYEALYTSMEFCPIPSIGSDSVTIRIFNQRGDKQPLVSATSKGKEPGSWSSFELTEVQETIEKYLAIERERIARARKEAQEQRKKMEQMALEQEIYAIKERGERLMLQGEGTLEDLVAAIQINERRALAALEDGINLVVPKVDGIDTRTVEGSRYYAVTYNPTSLIDQAVRVHRHARMEKSFSWGDWFDQIDAIGSGRQYQVTCLYPDVGDIPGKTGHVSTDLRNFSTSERTVSIVLDCNFGWFD